MATISDLQRARQERETAVNFLQQEWNERFEPELFSRSTVRMWLKRYRLSVEQLLEAIDSTECKLRLCPQMEFDNRGRPGNGCWLYFCAAVWNMIKPERSRLKTEKPTGFDWTNYHSRSTNLTMEKAGDWTKQLLKSIEDRENQAKQ